MQLQVKLYEEWVEVMRDYSTVFCTHDDVEESYFNGKSAKERSAEVFKYFFKKFILESLSFDSLYF